MTRDDVIRTAREAGFHFHDAGFAPTLHTVPLEYSEKCFERFAALIEAAATEKANERANTSWALMCEKMVKAEREACAKACDEIAADRWNLYKGHIPYTGNEEGRASAHVQGENNGAESCADAIRNRKDTAE